VRNEKGGGRVDGRGKGIEPQKLSFEESKKKKGWERKNIVGSPWGKYVTVRATGRTKVVQNRALDARKRQEGTS